MGQHVQQWGIFEADFDGPAEGNPFLEVDFAATFAQGHRTVDVEGFYDGEGTYRVRFMPDEPGEWRFTTRSNRPALDAKTGSFVCTAPTGSNHGPVRVAEQFHFAYADGTHYSNIGTTCYGWVHQDPAIVEQTLATLAEAPFNKIRMCVFPKAYRWNENEPQFHAFEVLEEGPTRWDGRWDNSGDAQWRLDWERFVPGHFRNVETRVGQLRELGIEADLILFHPYDRWGYSKMPPEAEDRYLRYVCARLASYRNVWWSFANEWDLLRNKTVEDWERYARVVRRHDPYDHLRGIHQCHRLYDHGRPWVTHVSYQGGPDQVSRLRKDYGKPVVVDECCYEGDVPNGWGNISAAEMTHRFWLATCLGGYCGHGETYLHPQDILWWGKGGTLHGQSPARIAFLRRIVEQGSGGFEPCNVHGHMAVARGEREILIFTHNHQPRVLEAKLPEGRSYSVEVIDPWAMTVDKRPGQHSGDIAIEMPVQPYMVVRAVEIE